MKSRRFIAVGITAVALLIPLGLAAVQWIEFTTVQHNLLTLQEAADLYAEAHQGQRPTSIRKIFENDGIAPETILTNPITGRSVAGRYGMVAWTSSEQCAAKDTVVFFFTQSGGSYLIQTNGNVLWDAGNARLKRIGVKLKYGSDETNLSK